VCSGTEEFTSGADLFKTARHCWEYLATPDLALGDVIFYVPNVWHLTQPLLVGERLGFLGNFFDPDRVMNWASSAPCLPSCSFLVLIHLFAPL